MPGLLVLRLSGLLGVPSRVLFCHMFSLEPYWPMCTHYGAEGLLSDNGFFPELSVPVGMAYSDVRTNIPIGKNSCC